MLTRAFSLFCKVAKVWASQKVARVQAAFCKASRLALVHLSFLIFKSNFLCHPKVQQFLVHNLWILFLFLTHGAIKQVHAADAPPRADQSNMDYEQYPPDAEYLDAADLADMKLRFMEELPPVDQALDINLFEVGSFLVCYLLEGRAPTPTVNADSSDPTGDDCLLINGQYLTYCSASRALLGFWDGSLTARPISLELNADSAVRLLTGLSVILSQIGFFRRDFENWLIEKHSDQHYEILNHRQDRWPTISQNEDPPQGQRLLDLAHLPFEESSTPSSRSEWVTLLSYPRLKQFYEQVRLFRCISIPNFVFRVMPEYCSISNILYLTKLHPTELHGAISVRQTITLEWHPALLEILDERAFTPEALTLLHKQLSTELVSAFLNLQALDALPFEIASIVSGQKLNMYLQLMLL